MSYSTALCSICHGILCPETDAEPSGLIEATGQTFEVFREAVEKGCVICSTIWNSDDQHFKAWSQTPHEAWEPVRFDPRKNVGEAGIQNSIDFHLWYQYPSKGRWAPLWIRLLPSNDSSYKTWFEHLHIEPSTSSTTALEMVHNWFINCRSSHPRCNELGNFKPDWFPKNLIDVGHQGSTDWRLRVVSEDGILPQSTPYLTLSYRWAPNPSLLLLTSNIIEFRRGKPIDGLPQLFKDLVVVAQRLSIRYIWIDALCIIQDSREDWEAQAPTMGMVYANSACTIAASASNSLDEGLFPARYPQNVLPGLVPCSLFSREIQPHYAFERYYWDREIHAGPLHKRGWVFQESALSSRTIYFGKNQVLWECLTEHRCEGFPEGVPGRRSGKELGPLLNLLPKINLTQPQKMDIHIFNMWVDLVRGYSQCALTKPSDKLFAIAGIARLFRDVTGDEYVAGLWKSWLLEMLDWRVEDPKELQSSEYRAPSWSWASVDGPRLTVELLDVFVQARTQNLMADVSEASIMLRVNTFAAICHYLENGRPMVWAEAYQFLNVFNVDNLSIELPEGKEIICMILKEDFYMTGGVGGVKHLFIVGLVLEELPCPSGSQARYRRLGSFREDQSEKIDLLYAMGTESKEITIV
ncbi:heterokaryon incompatibility protein-domain-containing protein [Xylaria telfairii]|nr:heterokaryon incompatibility protein-domain-containing protein [Xylaria telfairii]